MKAKEIIYAIDSWIDSMEYSYKDSTISVNVILKEWADLRNKLIPSKNGGVVQDE